MSQVCDICGRGSRTGNKVSHSQIKTSRKYKINIQTKRIGQEKKSICAKCIKTLSKVN